MDLNYPSLLVILVGIVLTFVVNPVWIGFAVIVIGILMRVPRMVGRT
jgi:hypothetical protein